MREAFARSGLRVKCGALAVALSCGAVSAGAQTIPAEVTAVARAELLASGATGGVIALVAGDRISTVAIGSTDTARSTPMQADLLFGTGSLLELYTGVVAATLAARGEIDLHAPIRRWAADLPPGVGALTLAHLLAQTSGLDDARDEPPRRGAGPSVWPGATDRALFTEPGALHSPSRHAPPLARAVLAAARGTTWDALLRETLLDPAGLARTTLDPAVAERLGAVPGLVVNSTATGPLHALAPTRSPLVQLHTTAAEIAHLLRILMADGRDGARRVLPAGVLDTVTRGRAVRPVQPSDSIAFGLYIDPFDGHRRLRHESTIGGYGVVIGWIPDAAVGVVALGNATGAALHRAADLALTEALRTEGLIVRTNAPSGASVPAVDDPAGRWANGDRIIVLERDGAALYWRDGDLRLRVERRGGELDVLVGDGRVAETLRTFRDAAGRDYLLVGDLAYRRDVSASDRR